MPRRTQVAKTPPKRKRSTSRNPTAEDLLKRCAARKPPRGELTAAEAIKDPSSGLAKAVALIGEQNSGLVKLVARTGEQLAAAWEPLMKQLRANDGLMQQVAAAAVQTQRDLEEIAPSCLEPDGHLNRTKFEARARVRLGLESGELWCMPMYEIVAQFREKAKWGIHFTQVTPIFCGLGSRDFGVPIGNDRAIRGWVNGHSLLHQPVEELAAAA